MKISLGFSPCPNDTFIFDAMVNKKIDTGGLVFETHLEDVQTLNNWAIEGKLDASKISYGVLPLILNEYNLLETGGALGKGVGPLLISRRNIPIKEIAGSRIAIPGINTSAHMLFSLAFPEAKKKEFLVFSEIEDAVLSGKFDAGVIIHENRFTYAQKGLQKLMDLGEFWEHETGSPIPLGGIIMKKKTDPKLQTAVNRLIRESLEFAFKNYPELPSYVRAHAQEMNEQVMRQHIDLYVNNFSLSLGKEGRNAIEVFMKIYQQLNPGNVSAALEMID